MNVANLKLELRPMLRLALPVVAAELGWMGMGVVDVMMVGRLGAEAIGAVSIGRALFIAVVIFGVGVLLGLDTLVARSFGAGRLRECHAWLIHGLYLSLLMAPPATLLVRILTLPLRRWGVSTEVMGLAVPYIEAVSWSALPIFLYAAFRRYLQAMNLVRPVMLALVTANFINVAFNWVLIFGHLGAPALGAPGSGWATLISCAYLAMFLLAVIWINERQGRNRLLDLPLRLEFERLRRLLGLGLPAAVQLLLEVGVFALVTALAGRLDASSLAAHQIALTAASVTYMVPLGVSSAGAVRVGQALGREDKRAAARAGWVALLLGGGFMLVPAAAFLLMPRVVIRIFTVDPRVVTAGVSLLYVAALFQWFDGIQVAATGALRGSGDTRTPMTWNLAGYWLLGLPVGYHLCFGLGWGAIGLWIGLSVGLIVVGSVLLFVWSRRTRHWLEEPGAVARSLG